MTEDIPALRAASRGKLLPELDKRMAALASRAPVTDKSAGHAVTAALAHLAADADPLIAGWIDQIEAMLGAAESLEEFREMLIAAYDHLPALDLTEALADALTAASLAGHAAVETADDR
jgi:phage gp29-like protein